MENLKNIIGKKVTAIGDSGMTKNMPVKGVLESVNFSSGTSLIKGKRGMLIAVTNRSIEEVK